MELQPINTTFAILFLLLCSSVAYSLHRNRKLALVINTVTLASLFAVSIYLLESGTTIQAFGFFEIYPFSMFLLAVSSVILLLLGFVAYSFSNSKFFSMVGFLLVGVFSVEAAASFLPILLGIELMAIPTSFMIISKDQHTLEAAVKFFIMSSTGAAMVAFGIALLYPFNPTLSLSGWFGTNMGSWYLPMIAFLLILSGLSFECALLPFNLWIADVYQGSPDYLPSMLSGINMVVTFAAIIEVMVLGFGSYLRPISEVIVLIAAATMLFGNLLAMRQKNVKRMMAYSSIVQAGYIAVGLAAYPAIGIGPALFYMASYAFAAVGAFSVVSYLDQKGIKTAADYSGLFYSSRLATVALTIFMLSMVGIPPLLGFVAKFVVFTAAVKSQLAWLAAFAIINSFVSIYYYGKVMLEMYAPVRPHARAVIPPALALVIIACALIILLLGIYPQPFLSASYSAANSLTASSLIPLPSQGVPIATTIASNNPMAIP